jgi:tyrosinase
VEHRRLSAPDKETPVSPNSPPSIVPPAPVAGPDDGAPPPPALRVRPNVEQANIRVLADAYATMQSRTETDNRSWVYWAEFHGFNRFDCWHHGAQGNQQFPYDLFLPWHRAYLLYFEQVAFAGASGPAALPWWDWSSALSHRQGIPTAFEQEPSLSSGPVASSFRADPPRTTRSPGPPDQLPSQQTVEGILGLTSFEDFSNQLQNQHDLIHGWTGGDMGQVVGSAFDPIFFSHHCMIDRLWYLWQVRHGVDNIPPNYLNLVLAPWHLTVKDVLSVNELGYTYGASRIIVRARDFASHAL